MMNNNTNNEQPNQNAVLPPVQTLREMKNSHFCLQRRQSYTVFRKI